MSFVIIHGHKHPAGEALAYVERIVYGNPRIDVVEVGQSSFVAIAEYSDSQSVQCASTFDRLVSFSGISGQLINDLDVALREFGVWLRHYAPGTIVGFDREETTQRSASETAAYALGHLRERR